nr:ChuX/HutX family heme-like substrate-binding protein [Thiopseudomonas alkaliphila]
MFSVGLGLGAGTLECVPAPGATESKKAAAHGGGLSGLLCDPEFNLHLKVNAIKQLWRVRKPSTDGLITSWEAFDSAGNLIVQLFGARKPGIPELASWRAIAEQTPALEA